MNSELESLLPACVTALARHATQLSNDPQCWVRWMGCVSEFQADKYENAAKDAAFVLAHHCRYDWFVPLQFLLMSLKYTEESEAFRVWGQMLIFAPPASKWQMTLMRLVFDQRDVGDVLPYAADDDERCQALYYGGENYLYAGQMERARAAFEKCAALDAACMERQLAKSRIEALQKRAGTLQAKDSFTVTAKSSTRRIAETESERQRVLRQDSGENLLRAVSQFLSGDSLDDIMLRADNLRGEAWSRIIRQLAAMRDVHALGGHDDDFQWLPVRVRHALADAYKREFLKEIEQAHLIENDPAVKQFFLIRGADLLAFPQFPNYHTVKDRLTAYADIKGGSTMYFISHRWLSDDHPDPKGIHMGLLRSQLRQDAYYWIDYTCIPQHPRTPPEERIFQESLSWLPALLFNMNVIIVRSRNDDYFERAWCFFENLAANVLGQQVVYIFEDAQLGDSQVASERNTLERTLLDMDLPATLTSKEANDLKTISTLVQNVAFFFKLRVTEHYLSLGQQITNNALFWGEDPYYFVATCDFSRVMLWLFDKAKALGLPLIDLSKDPYSDNFLVKIANNGHEHQKFVTYNMPKKVALDESRLRWFSANRLRTDAETNLFFLLTSMIN